MKHIKFTIVEDERTGDYGALPNIFRNWDSYIASFGLGHDLIEHSTKAGQETGEVFQELRALGAHLFVGNFDRHKKMSQYFERSPKGAGKSFASDLDSTLTDQEEGIDALPKAPQAKLTKGEEADFAEFWKGVRRGIIEFREYDQEGETTKFYWRNRAEILAWLKYGFYLAKKRYKGDSWGAYEMRETIIPDTLRKFADDIDQEAREGEQFTLNYSVENRYCEITNGWEVW